MMISKFKVNKAKERISKLTEKYSKTAVNVRKILSSPSESDSGSSLKNEIHKPEVQIQSTVSPSTNLINQTNDDSIGKVNENKILLNADSTSPNENFDYCLEFENDILEDSTEESISVIQDLSNQFERIRFISSSSEDISSIVPNLKSKSEVSSIGSVSENLPVIDLDNQLTAKFNCIDEKMHAGNTPESVEKQSSKSTHLTESALESQMSSVKELSSETEIEANKKELNNCHKTDKTNLVSQNSNIELNLASDSPASSRKNTFNKHNKSTSIKKSEHEDSVKNISPSSSRKGSFDKHKKSKSNKKFWHKDSDIVFPVSNDRNMLKQHCIYADKSTNTKLMQKLKMSSKHTQCEITQIPKEGYKPTNKYLKKYRPHSYINLYTYPKPDSQPLIRPSKLISFVKMEKDNLKTEASVPVGIQFLQNDINDDIFTNKTELTCDDVIHQLLKNQIQLTRHFIESHQQMYLQVYKAAELLHTNRP